MLKLWQELQEINPDIDKRGSKNNIFPNSTISAFSTFAGLIGWIGSLAEVLTEMTSMPIDISDATSICIFIGTLPNLIISGCNGAADYA
jgi:hypothetical protein